MTAKESGRPEKVAARIQEEVSEMLLRGDIHEPDATGVFCSSVRVTSDLSLAYVGVRSLETEPTELRKKRVVAAMKRASGFVRRTVGKKLGLRQAPDLRFDWDSGIDHARRIDELLAEIDAERGGRK